MKNELAMALLFLVTRQLFAQTVKSDPAKMTKTGNTEHYTFKLSDKVTRQKVSFF